ncbi:MAG: YbaK/EbsC family protein [bacterium]
MAKMTDLLKYLTANSVQYEIIEHEPAFSAHEVALASHVADKDLAKAIVIQVDEKYWMAVLRADQRINEHLIKQIFAAKHIQLAHEDDLTKLFPDCQLGAMPPFGNLYGLPIMVDEALASDEEIVFNACTHTKSIRITFKDFRRLVKPVTAQFAEAPYRREDKDFE